MDTIKNEQIRETVKVEQYGDKVREERRRWFGHWRFTEFTGQGSLEMELISKRKSGRPEKSLWIL